MDLRPAKAKSSAAERRVPLWVLAAIPTLLTAFFYLPMLKNGFVNWDDPGVVEQNLHIRSLSLNSIQWWFSNFYKGFFIPLTWFSLALDYRIGGLDPWFFHLHNLFLHLVNTTLVFFLGMKLFPLAFNEENSDGKAAWVGAASMASAVPQRRRKKYFFMELPNKPLRFMQLRYLKVARSCQILVRTSALIF